jgi:hypothetical protein
MTANQIRAGGALLAALMAFALLLLFGFGTNELVSSVPSYFVGLIVASVIGAALGAAVVAPGVDANEATPPAALEMTAIALVTAALLWPLAVAITALPSAVYGGTIPCLNIGGAATACPNGLFGLEALGRLAGEIGGLYRIVAGFVLSPAIVAAAVACLAFSICWRSVFRQGMTADAALTSTR